MRLFDSHFPLEAGLSVRLARGQSLRFETPWGIKLDVPWNCNLELTKLHLFNILHAHGIRIRIKGVLVLIAQRNKWLVNGSTSLRFSVERYLRLSRLYRALASKCVFFVILRLKELLKLRIRVFRLKPKL